MKKNSFCTIFLLFFLDFIFRKDEIKTNSNLLFILLDVRQDKMWLGYNHTILCFRSTSVVQFLLQEIFFVCSYHAAVDRKNCKLFSKVSFTMLFPLLNVFFTESIKNDRTQSSYENGWIVYSGFRIQQHQGEVPILLVCSGIYRYFHWSWHVVLKT
jgi:hypothetical protein